MRILAKRMSDAIAFSQQARKTTLIEGLLLLAAKRPHGARRVARQELARADGDTLQVEQPEPGTLAQTSDLMMAPLREHDTDARQPASLWNKRGYDLASRTRDPRPSPLAVELRPIPLDLLVVDPVDEFVVAGSKCVVAKGAQVLDGDGSI